MTDTSLPVRVPTVVEDDDADFTVVATNPEQMVRAQRSLILWCARKIDAAKKMLEDTRQLFKIAADSNWRSDAWNRQVRQAEQRVEFYRKIKAALEAGYYIVPPLPIEIFAIRTDRKTADRKTSTARWGNRHEQSPRVLPLGEGRYVSNQPQVYQRTIPAADASEKKDVTQYFARDFLPVDFPFKLAKPAVLAETARAMALKLFDQMGVLPATRGADPIVCGQILDPKRTYGPRRSVTFFVAWWLDTTAL